MANISFIGVLSDYSQGEYVNMAIYTSAAVGICTLGNSAVRHINKKLTGSNDGIVELTQRSINWLVSRGQVVSENTTPESNQRLLLSVSGGHIRTLFDYVLVQQQPVVIRDVGVTPPPQTDQQQQTDLQQATTAEQQPQTAAAALQQQQQTDLQQATTAESQPQLTVRDLLPLPVDVRQNIYCAIDMATGIQNGRNSSALAEVLITIFGSDSMLRYLINSNPNGEVRSALIDLANNLRGERRCIDAEQLVDFRKLIGFQDDEKGYNPIQYFKQLLGVGDTFGSDRFFALGSFNTMPGKIMTTRTGIQQTEQSGRLVDRNNGVLVLQKRGLDQVHPDLTVTVDGQVYILRSIIAKKGQTDQYHSYFIRDQGVYFHCSSFSVKEGEMMIPITQLAPGLYEALRRDTIPDSNKLLCKNYESLTRDANICIYERATEEQQPAAPRQSTPAQTVPVQQLPGASAERLDPS